MDLCLREVWVEDVLGKVVRIYDGSGRLISEQPVHLFEDGRRPEHPEHGIMNERYQDRRRVFRSSLVGRFIELFGRVGEQFILALREREGCNLYWHLSEILAYGDLYEWEEVRGVLESCIQIGSYHKNSVLRLLDARRLKHPPLGVSLPSFGSSAESLTRPLSAYAVLGEGCYE